MMFLLLGCIPQTTLQLVSLSGAVFTDADAPVLAEVHQAWRGEGLLQHPGGLLEALPVEDDGTFSAEVLVPVEEGEGLAVYAWQDLDGDGLLCAPGQAEELAGAAAIETLDFTLTLDVTLTTPCTGAEVLIAEAL